jgi:hypothetical protein
MSSIPTHARLTALADASKLHMRQLDAKLYGDITTATPSDGSVAEQAEKWRNFRLSDGDLAHKDAQALRELIKELPDIYEAAQQYAIAQHGAAPDGQCKRESTPLHVVVVGNTRSGKSAFIRHVLTALSGEQVFDTRVVVAQDERVGVSSTPRSCNYDVSFGSTRLSLIDTRGWSEDPWQAHIDRTAGIILGTTQIGHDAAAADGSASVPTAHAVALRQQHTPASIVVLVVSAAELIGPEDQVQEIRRQKDQIAALNQSSDKYDELAKRARDKIAECRKASKPHQQDLEQRFSTLRKILIDFGIPLRVVVTKADTVDFEDLPAINMVERGQTDMICNYGFNHNAFVDDENNKRGLLIMYRIVRSLFPTIWRSPAMLRAQGSLDAALSARLQQLPQPSPPDGQQAEQAPARHKSASRCSCTRALLLLAVCVALVAVFIANLPTPARPTARSL